MDLEKVFECKKSLEQCLYKFLDENHFLFRYIKPDGDCFFNSLIQSGVPKLKKTVQELRNLIVTHLKKPDIMAMLRTAGVSGNINQLRNPSSWAMSAGDLVSQYASAAFGIHLVIYDVRNENDTIVINKWSFPNSNESAPIVRLLRTGNNHYSLLLHKGPSNSNMLGKSHVALMYMASNLPTPSARRMRVAQSNTGTSTVPGFKSGIATEEDLLNAEVTSHSQLTQKVANMINETHIERDKEIIEHTSKSPWYEYIQKMMTNRSPKEPHLTLLELCKKHPIHRCLRAIHHYFGAFLDHGHDWKNITWCVLPNSLKKDADILKGMVRGLPMSDISKGKLIAWITTWTRKVLEIRTGNGVSQKRCREYLNILNEEYVCRVNDPEIMSGEPLAYWLPTDFAHTIQQSWEFSEKERAEKMAEMKVYLQSLGIRAMYFESGANWMDEIVKKQGNGNLTLNQIHNTNELVALGIWPHAAYNAASCGVSLCSAYAGTCKRKCSIPIQMEGMEILGARVDVIMPRNTTRVNLVGLSEVHERALVREGGILIRKGRHYILRPGDPIELSLNALSKTIEDSIGTYRRGDVNNNAIATLVFEGSAEISSAERDEMVTILKTWTDAVQLRGASALKWHIETQFKGGKMVYIAFVTLDYMCLESAITEDIPFALFSSTVYPAEDAPTDTPTRHRYTLHCFDNTVIKANEQGNFDEKAKTFAWICQKAVRGELDSMLDALMENKKQQLRLVADSVADPALFFACHQTIESVTIHTRQAHSRCEQIKSLVKRMKNPNDDIKQAVEKAIEAGPLNPSDTLKDIASLHTLSEKFSRSVGELHNTTDTLYDADTPRKFLDSYTAARQDVRNSGVTNNEQEIELYAVCMMVMEYMRTGHIAAIEKLIGIQAKAFDMVKETYKTWLEEKYPSGNNALRNLQLAPDDFIMEWAAKGKISEKTQKILQQLHNPMNMTTIDRNGAVRNVKNTPSGTGRLGFAVVIQNIDFKDILKATTMCLYIIHAMTKPSSGLAYGKLNETSNENMTKEEKKEEARELANTGKLHLFKGYHEQLQEQLRTFTLRMVGVPFSSLFEACLADPNLYCKECPADKQCVICTGSACRVVGHSSSSSAAMNATSAPMPPLPSTLGRRSSSQAGLPQRNSTVNDNTNGSAVAASASAGMNNTNPLSNSKRKKGGGTKKRKSKTCKRQQHKRQKRKTQKRKTRKN